MLVMLVPFNAPQEVKYPVFPAGELEPEKPSGSEAKRLQETSKIPAASLRERLLHFLALPN